MPRRSLWPLDIADAIETDRRLHGTRFILAEFTAGLLFTAALGSAEIAVAMLRHAPLPYMLAGAWLLSFALNCATVLVVTVRLARNRSLLAEGRLEWGKVKQYTLQLPMLLFIPLVLPVLTIAQALSTPSEDAKR
jgi:hypothetical protein